MISCHLTSLPSQRRILGWGAGIGIGSASIPEVLQQVQRASVSVLDRWRLSIPDDGAKKKQKDVVFNNYFGIGTASVCISILVFLF